MIKLLHVEVKIWDKNTKPKIFNLESPLNKTHIYYETDSNGKIFINEDDVESYVLNYYSDEDTLRRLGYSFDAEIRFLAFDIYDWDEE